jgi:hypothetical protein
MLQAGFLRVSVNSDIIEQNAFFVSDLGQIGRQLFSVLTNVDRGATRQIYSERIDLSQRYPAQIRA